MKDMNEIVWFKPITGGARTNRSVVLTVKKSSNGKDKNRTRVAIYPELMKLARIIMGDKIAFGVNKDFYIIARNHDGYTLSPMGGTKSHHVVAGTISIPSIVAECNEEYVMQDIELRDDGSILVLRSKRKESVCV